MFTNYYWPWQGRIHAVFWLGAGVRGALVECENGGGGGGGGGFEIQELRREVAL